MKRYLCIHGHFYQPPRENVWLEAIERQDSAYPYHDWNERVAAECYGPNADSRILDEENRIIDIVNNYEKISFNFGPTLLAWLEKHKPEIYRKILEADQKSIRRFGGHGSAIAQAYNHMILPLANRRDKRTQVIWGIRDFERRFGRRPEGMWLPEMAVDSETLEILADEGIAFTVLSQHQAKKVRKIGTEPWKELQKEKIDPKRAYRCTLPSGRTIALFFRDEHVSHEVAFKKLLDNGEKLAAHMMKIFTEEGTEPQLASIAIDGETFGHHHKQGEMSLSYALYAIETGGQAEMTNYAEFLTMSPPSYEVQIVENSSWSCVHGIERWRSDCGCNSGKYPQWNQKWRAPLRNAMDWLRDILAALYEEQMSGLLKEPWTARDHYIDVVLDRSGGQIDGFFETRARKRLNAEQKRRALKLLEMQRHAMLMYTSCGWFFDELSGLESVQVLHYAGRAMQLAGETAGILLEAPFAKLLQLAPSNLPKFHDGKKIYEMFVETAAIDFYRLAAHYALSSLFEHYAPTAGIYCYTVEQKSYEYLESGPYRLAVGNALFRSEITLEEARLCFAGVYLGGYNLFCGVGDFRDRAAFERQGDAVKESFYKGNEPELFKQIEASFPEKSYTLWHLFRDEQRRILEPILKEQTQGGELLYRQLYEQHLPLMQMTADMNAPLPEILAVTAEHVLNEEAYGLLQAEKIDAPALVQVMEAFEKWSLRPDRKKLCFLASKRIDDLMARLQKRPQEPELLSELEAHFRMFEAVGIETDLREAQNIYFRMGKTYYSRIQERAQGDPRSSAWMEHFAALQHFLGIKVL